MPYIEAHIAKGGKLFNITRHVLGTYHGRPGGRLFRRHLSEQGVKAGARADVLLEAIGIAESGKSSAAREIIRAAE